MANPLFNQVGNNPQNNPFAQIMCEAQKLKNSFKGNPQEEVQRLLNSGEMSQADFNRYSQIANQVLQFMGSL
jgi:hypothetical protein